MTTETDSLHKTWEFKGIEIKPLSRARKFHLSKLVDFSKLSPWDAAVMVYALICPESELMKGLRNLDAFNGKVSEWIEENEIDLSDFNEETGKMLAEIVNHTNENRAQPVKDPAMMSDPGNF